MDKTMWAVQVNEFPDSVKLEDSQVLEMIMSAVPDWLRDMTVEQWREELIGGYDNANDELLAFRAWCDKETMRARFMWSISAFGNRSQSSDGFFYACGKQDNGWYKHIGFRMGLDPSDYASGYMGLNFKNYGKESK